MLKLKDIIGTSLRIKTSETLGKKTNNRSVHESYFVSDDDIMENILGHFITIGINLPESKNILTETALEKLNESIQTFENDDGIHAAVLHGCGGNFCAGVVRTNTAFELGQNLMKTLHTMKKPIIAALDGYTTDFGLHLAVMCDMRVMEKSALAGTRNLSRKSEIFPFMYERLILTVGLSRTVELMCSRQTYTAAECFTMGLANKITDSGCALGQSISLAQNIAFNSPLENIIEHKSKILSFINGKI